MLCRLEVPHKLARLAVLRSALPRNANDKPEVATINIEGTEKVIPIDIEDCKKAPQDTFSIRRSAPML